MDLVETYTLPEYKIDSLSHHGLKPQETKGEVVFKDVRFAYPAHPDNVIFNGLNLKIESGKTVAFGPLCGGGFCDLFLCICNVGIGMVSL